MPAVQLPYVPAGRLPAPGPEYLPSVAERRRVERIVADRLLEYSPGWNVSAVLQTVDDSARELRVHGVQHGLEPAVEAMSRSRLERLPPSRPRRPSAPVLRDADRAMSA